MQIKSNERLLRFDTKIKLYHILTIQSQSVQTQSWSFRFGLNNFCLSVFETEENSVLCSINDLGLQINPQHCYMKKSLHNFQ